MTVRVTASGTVNGRTDGVADVASAADTGPAWQRSDRVIGCVMADEFMTAPPAP